jgi:hypothetical protein
MRKTLLFTLSLIVFLVACDSMTVVSRVPLGTPRTATQSQSCSYAGLCQACEFRNGKQKCYLGFHQSCDGRRDATVNIQDFTVKYKDGHVDTESTTTVQSYLGECK